MASSISVRAASVALTRPHWPANASTWPGRSAWGTPAFASACSNLALTSSVRRRPAPAGSTWAIIRDWKPATFCNSSALVRVSASAARARIRCWSSWALDVRRSSFFLASSRFARVCTAITEPVPTTMASRTDAASAATTGFRLHQSHARSAPPTRLAEIGRESSQAWRSSARACAEA